MAATIHRVRQAVRFVLAGMGVLLLGGCQSFNVSPVAHIRVIDLSPDAVSMDVYRDGNALAYNLSYGAVTSYVPTPAGTYSLTVDLAGTKQVLSTIKGDFTPGGHYTVLVNNPVVNLQQVLLMDHAVNQGPPVPSVRLIHQAHRAGAVDVYLVPAGQRLTSVRPVVTNLAPGATTAYLAVPAGVSTALMLPTGTVPSPATVPAHMGAQLSYEPGVLRSLILIDAQPTQPQSVQVIATVDSETLNQPL